MTPLVSISLKRVFVLLFVFTFSLMLPAGLMGQGRVSGESDKDALPRASSYFMLQENHIPGQLLNRAEKTIYIAINVWQRDDGSGNFQDTDAFYLRMQELVERLSRVFSHASAPTHPIEGVYYLLDSHIRFELKDVAFYKDNSLHTVGCGAGTRLNNAVFALHPEKRQYLNIHFVKGNCRGGSGYANYPNEQRMDEDSFIVSYMRDAQDDLDEYPFWALMLHVAHELGHNLGLKHPYDSEYCNFSHPDFLFDLFGYEKQSWCIETRRGCDVCYHEGGWSCDTQDPTTTCTNNLMGGNKDSRSITPLQMGRMNRSLMLTSVRKYAWGYSREPYRLAQSEIWDIPAKFYRDVVVESGSTLIVTSTIEMVPQASIIVESGGRLILDGGKVTNALYSNSKWQGVVLMPAQKKGFAFWRKTIPEAELIFENGGSLENHYQ